MCTQVFDRRVESKSAIAGEKEREFGARERGDWIEDTIQKV